ncbi:hypothetical protein M407DRAFT_243067 [Tulasnella calospora MUT 4182]|uniref:SRCR domain-containing protein n=1 Tax=Tulasnella calospora MUT 4182 TaxID=1051891 RepID=A0A0C3L3G0_9AGAM|nr:hypothetical protein M407DRAFT_243067 [Tulasnella calospora MUT 4182]
MVSAELAPCGHWKSNLSWGLTSSWGKQAAVACRGLGFAVAAMLFVRAELSELGRTSSEVIHNRHSSCQ